MGNTNGTYFGNTRLIGQYVFIPPSCSYTEEKPYPVTWIMTKTGKKIPAYHLVNKKKKTKTTILYSHGNASDIGLMIDLLMLLMEYCEVNVFHYEYLGYGLAKNSSGPPTEVSTYESCEAALSYLNEKVGINNSDIILYGTSGIFVVVLFVFKVGFMC